MSERLIEKIDRLGAEAGVETMTPEIRRFALLVRQDTVAQWPDLTEQQRESYQKGHNDGVAHHKQAVKAAQSEQDLIPKDDLFVCGQMGAHVTKVYAQPEQEENTKQRVLQLIKELRPAIRPMEALGKPMTTQEWFDVLVKNIEVMI